MAKKRNAAKRALAKMLSANEARHKAGIVACDFCHAPDAQFGAGCPDFVVEAFNAIPPRQESVGDWAMCFECAVFVHSGERKGLLQRVIHEFNTRHPELGGEPDFIAQRDHLIEDAFRQFWHFFTGEIYDITDAQRRHACKVNIESDRHNRKVFETLLGPLAKDVK